MESCETVRSDIVALSIRLIEEATEKALNIMHDDINRTDQNIQNSQQTISKVSYLPKEQMGNKTGKNFFSQLWKRSSTNSSKFFLTIPSNEQIALETFLLVWLDPHVNTSDENRETQVKLRKVLTCLYTFDNVTTCEKWLKEYDANEKLILIVSGAYGNQIVPKVHYLPTIISIYVYCLDVNRNKTWSMDYSKVQSVVSDTDELLKQISMHQNNLENVEDSKALQTYSLDIKIASYTWYNLLLEILLSSDYLPSSSTFREFIQILREYCSNDEYGSSLITTFEKTYDSQDAVLWLTNDTPLVRFVNKALREQDINMLFVLRFLLIDIHKQLMKHQANSLRVFRIQQMMKSQMHHILANPGQILTFNGFLFASTDKNKLISTMKADDQFETVLVDIKATYRPGVASFAVLSDINSDISKQIGHEVLFMCDSIFRIGSLTLRNSIWVLELTLIGDNDLNELSKMKEQLKCDLNLCIISDLLHYCEKPDKAIAYCQRLSNELPKQHALMPRINKELSKTSRQTNSSSLADVQFVVINLSSHLNDLTSVLLATLFSLASDSIVIYQNETKLDFSQWPNKIILLFTTTQFAATLKNVPTCVTIYALNSDDCNFEDPYHFATIQDLVDQLSNAIVQKYRLETCRYNQIGEPDKAKEQEMKANRVEHEIKKVYEQMKENSPKKPLHNIALTIIWLRPEVGDMESLKEVFGEYFSSYHSFFNQHTCHYYIVENEHRNDIFLIMNTSSEQSIANGFRQFSNVKNIYFYGQSTNSDEKTFDTRNDLYYRLTYDLIGHYGELGDNYQENDQLKEARDFFMNTVEDIEYDTNYSLVDTHWLLLYDDHRDQTGPSIAVEVAHAHLLKFIRTYHTLPDCQQHIRNNRQKTIKLFITNNKLVDWDNNADASDLDLKKLYIYCNTARSFADMKRWNGCYQDKIEDVFMYDELNYRLVYVGINHANEASKIFETNAGLYRKCLEDARRLCDALSDKFQKKKDMIDIKLSEQSTQQ
ncbi:unnamed protein product [Rotaria socialis]|uniref:Uncharacterized protein n=1 Tax=Rotaria socialis TaxID=392032 RepID=A0A820RA02_9BILA|nr:unnamed protein product [Rotaria socialis]